jgi:two-component system C4-dicarboxylate transport response regulator DctD
MPGTDGVALMRTALERDAELPVILVTGHGDVDLAVQSMREGAYDFIEKPYAPARLVETVRRALDKRRLTLENRALRAAVAVPDTGTDPVAARLLGQSAPMRALRLQLRAVAATEADVLIDGATGTGKELAARALMRRARAPSVRSCRSTAPPCPPS